MTMLDRMRRHRNWLKWSLAIVSVAMVIYLIPAFVDTSGSVTTADAVATVDGHEIQADEFRRTYQAQLQAYRQAYGGNMSDQLLKQLGVEQQILAQMVDERAALAEAQRVGLTASDEEVRQRILTIPAFQENGVFIGEQRYRDLLNAQRPPMSTAEFEEAIRRSLIVDKLRAAVTEWLSIPEAEIEQEYRRRNDKIKLAVVAFAAESFRPDVSATDEELTKHFDANKEQFRVPEKRKIKYVLVDVDALRAKVVVPQADIERFYNQNLDQYTTPEQVRASHILLKTAGKDDAQVRARAEALAKEARGGADFAALAKQNSEDEASAPNGGDLDFFGRGRMVPEFDAAVFAMEAGQVSDPVKTEYGYHVIKLTEKKPGTSRSIDELKPQITEQIAFERAQAQAADLAQRLDAQINSAADLDRVAKANGLTVEESGFFARDEPITGLGASPEAAARAFELEPGGVSGAIATGRGFVIETVVEKKDAYLPNLDEVKERVRDDLVKRKAQEFGRKKAADVAAKVKGAANFEAAAKTAGFEAKTTELVTRDTPLPDLGMATAVVEAAFRMPVGAVSDPIDTETGTAIVKVLEKQEVTEQELAANRDQFRQDLLTDRRNRFFSAYMVKAKQKMRIEYNREALQRLVG